MANLFNSNPLMGLGLALSTFGGQESMGTAMNLLNYAQRQQLIDAEREKELNKEARPAEYLKNSGYLDLPKPDVMTDISNALNGVKPQQQRPLTIGEQVFNGYGPNTDTSKVDLMRAVGAENLLNSKLAAMADASKPRELAAGAILTDATGRVIARNDKPDEQPNDVREALFAAGGDPVKARALLAQKYAKTGTEETWANPVAEVDPVGGGLIQVRYGSKGGRQVVTGATPAKQGNSYDRQDYWRGQVKPLVDSFTNAETMANKVQSSLSLGTGTGQIAAINALQKMIDEGAVVREQDVALIQSAQSVLSQYQGKIDQIKSGKLLSPTMMKELQGVADQLRETTADAVRERIQSYQPAMSDEGVKFESVLPTGMQRKMLSRTEKQIFGQNSMRMLPQEAKAGPGGNSFRVGRAIVTPIP